MSSVPAYKRKEAKVEFINTYHVLRNRVIAILMRDFGIKARAYDIDFISELYRMSPEDRDIFLKLSEDYKITSMDVDKYPMWLIDTWRTQVMSILNDIGINITAANAIYITNECEFSYRRCLWNNAIGYLHALREKLNEITDIITVKIGAYTEVYNIILKEINLIKGVRKSDNDILSKIRARQSANRSDFLSVMSPYYNDLYSHLIPYAVIGSEGLKHNFGTASVPMPRPNTVSMCRIINVESDSKKSETNQN